MWRSPGDLPFLSCFCTWLADVQHELTRAYVNNIQDFQIELYVNVFKIECLNVVPLDGRTFTVRLASASKLSANCLAALRTILDISALPSCCKTLRFLLVFDGLCMVFAGVCKPKGHSKPRFKLSIVALKLTTVGFSAHPAASRSKLSALGHGQEAIKALKLATS